MPDSTIHLWPYTNPHELNLDWIIQTVKQLGLDFETLKKWCEDYLDNLDISDDVNAKINQMVTDGTLTPMIEAAVRNITEPLVNAAIPELAVPLINAAINAKIGDIDTAISNAEDATTAARSAASAANAATSFAKNAANTANNSASAADTATEAATNAAASAAAAAQRAETAAEIAESNFMNITVSYLAGTGIRLNYNLQQITQAYKKGSNITAHWNSGERIDIIGYVRNTDGSLYCPVFVETDTLNTPAVCTPTSMASTTTDFNRWVLNATYDVYSGDNIIGQAQVKTGVHGTPCVLVTRTGEVTDTPYIASCNDLITALSYIALAQSYQVATGVTSLQIGGYGNSQADAAFLYNISDSASTLTMNAAGTVWVSRYTFPWISIRQ